MAGNAKRVNKKLKAIEDAFVGLPKPHRVKPVWEAITAVSGVKPERAAEHFKLALAMISAPGEANG